MSRTKDWWMEIQFREELLNRYKFEEYTQCISYDIQNVFNNKK